jgi:hypothetical protein
MSTLGRRVPRGWLALMLLVIGASLGAAEDTDKAIARIREGQHTPVPTPLTTPIPGVVAEGLVVENRTGYTLNLYFKGPIVRTIVLKDRDFSAVALVPGSYEIAAEAVEARILPFYSRQMYEARVRYTLTFFKGNPVR